MPTEVARVVDRVLLENSYKHVGISVGVRRGEETFLAGRGRVGGDRRYPPDERTVNRLYVDRSPVRSSY